MKTQTFNSGVVRVYRVTNTAPPGVKPAEALVLKGTLRYHERTVGLTRFYTALQAQVNVQYLLRCPRRRDISPQDIAIPNDGEQYRITLIQYPEDVEPPCMDLTLSAVQAKYDIAGGDGG